jgi:quinone-modifying oxidoreductase, subunit QmoC
VRTDATAYPAVGVDGLARRSASADVPRVDFGWRFHGKEVSLLSDRSVQMVGPEKPVEGALAPFDNDLTALQACLQCGACTANCSLADDDSHFPRRQMNLFQMGQLEQLMADRTIWFCYNCGDCSTRCPSGARPGRLMGAVRQMAVEHFACPASLGRLVNQPRRWWWMAAIAAVLLLGAVAVGGSFAPAVDRVEYATFLPHATVNVFFFAFTGLAFAALTVGGMRAWTVYLDEPPWRSRLRIFLRAYRAALADVLAHRRLTDCTDHPRRGYAHFAVFYGFVGLFALAGVAAALILVGGPYPFAAWHPLKIIGNLAAVLLIVGTAYFAYERRVAAKQGDASTYFDWWLLVNLLLAGVTGVGCELLRYLNVAVLAYPLYFLHLVCVFMLLVFLPYSKLAHVSYRTLALASREYDAIMAAGSVGRPAPAPPVPSRPARPAYVPRPEAPVPAATVLTGHTALGD